MSVHTYIGARYVPRFIGTYDPTQIYDALDVVDNGSGTSYIARKTVPAGTPLTDTSHWFIYGASSGAIIQLQQDVSDLQKRADKDHSVLILGDSYCRPGYVPAGKDWMALLEARDNYVLYNYAVGGAGFARHQTGSVYIDDEITAAVSGVPDPDQIGHVVLMAGLNDYVLGADMDQIYTAVKSTIALIRSNFPHAEIYYMPFNFPYNAYINYKHMEYLGAFCDAGHDTGVFTNEYMPFMFANRPLSYYIDSGTQHPNEAGNEVMYQLVRNMLEGNAEPITYMRHFVPVAWNGVTVLDNIRGWMKLKADKFESQICFIVAAGTYTAGTYRIAEPRDGNGVVATFPGVNEVDVVYDNKNYDFGTYDVTFKTNQADNSIRAIFAHNQTFGVASGYYKFSGSIIDKTS